MYCNTIQFPVPYCGPHSKLHGVRGLSKHYHFLFDQKLGNGVCAIRCIPCACIPFTSMLYKPWMYGIPTYEQERYKPATTTSHSKRLISFLKDKHVLTTSLSTIWENTDGCDEQYICASALYLI